MFDKFIHSAPTLIDLLAVVVCIGSLSCRVWLVRGTSGAFDERDQRCMLRNLWMLLGASVVMLVFSSSIILIARSAEMSGLTLAEGVAVIPRVVSHTHFGRVWTVRLTAVALLCAIWWTGRRDLHNRRSPILMLIAATVVAATRSASSHAADAGDLSLSELMDWLHLVAASVWGGGLIALSVAVFPAVFKLSEDRRKYVTEIAVRFSGLAGIAFIIVVITAAYQGWIEVGSIRALVGTDYGKLIIVKSTLALVLIMIAASNRYISIPRLLDISASGDENDRTITRFVMKVRAEAFIIAAILICTAFLIHNTPAKNSFHPGYKHVHGVAG